MSYCHGLCAEHEQTIKELRKQVAELTAQREDAFGEYTRCAGTPLMADVLTERDELRSQLSQTVKVADSLAEALKKLELKNGLCPVCGYATYHLLKHRGDCYLSAALAEYAATKQPAQEPRAEKR